MMFILTEKDYFKATKTHLKFAKKSKLITKKKILENLSNHECPFKLGSFDSELGTHYLAFNVIGKRCCNYDAGLYWDETTDYFSKNRDRILPKLIKMIKETNWKK